MHFPNRKAAGKTIFKILKTPGVGRMGPSPVEVNVGEGSPSEQRDHDIRPEQGWRAQSYNPSDMGDQSRKIANSISDWPPK